MRTHKFARIVKLVLVCVVFFMFFKFHKSTRPRLNQELQTMIENGRRKILDEIDTTSFEEREELIKLIPEGGGKPKVILIATTWRSGSTFLGELLNTKLGTFYSYEPLHLIGIRQARYGELAEKSVGILKNLMTCNFTDMSEYLQYSMKIKYFTQKNERLNHFCKNKEDLCWEPEFFHQFCSLFPHHLIKTTRLRLNLTRTLVASNKYELKVLVLVRDPRGTTNSRKHVKFCSLYPDDCNVESLCDDLVSDYHAFKQLKQQFPDNYMVLRYEDLALEPYQQSKQIFNFLSLNMDENVRRFLDKHTADGIGGGTDYGTFKDSKTIPLKWRDKLSTEEVLNIQEKCSDAMKFWAYRSFEVHEELAELDPLIQTNFNQ